MPSRVKSQPLEPSGVAVPTPLRSSRSSTRIPVRVPSTWTAGPHVALNEPENVEAVSWDTNHCRSLQEFADGTGADELEFHWPTSSDASADGALGFNPLSLLTSQPADRIVMRQAEHAISFAPRPAAGTVMLGERRLTLFDGANSGPRWLRDMWVEDSVKVVA